MPTWKRAENNRRVIGFVISFTTLMLQLAHYQRVGGVLEVEMLNRILSS
jgi:hypothetical protein